MYREQGFLNIEIDKPHYEFEGPLARVVLPIHEGPQFTVSDVTVAGNAAIPTPELLIDLPVNPSDPYQPAAAENALQHIRDLYWTRGYNDVRPTYQLTIDRIGGRVGVAFNINEGRQSIVTGVRIAGNDKTTDHLVREELMITPAEPLNLTLLSRSRKNLYDSGAFSVVDLSRDTVVESTDKSLVGAISGPAQKPVQVDVSVREVQPYQLRYGASYDTEGKLGGVFDASAHNVLGKARVVGIASRYDARLREGRLYMTQPTLRYWPIQTTATIYYQEERNPTTSISHAFNVDRRGASLQQERKLKNSYVWNYGYRFENARTFDPVPGATADVVTKVSPLSSAFVRDVRDDVLDATRGSFASNAFSFSPKWLGSDDTYMKYFGQYFHYFPLQKERRKRFSNEIIRPRFVFASAFRLGVSKGMGTFVPVSERFFAGGSTTLRGFEQNAVGPIGADGKPAGGDAMFVMNNELRFPLVSLLDGVVFSDIGNVWQRSKDISFTDLRKTAGVGLRVRTKWVLVRGDYGFVLDSRAGERKSRFYFSIGQAF
jgi:outer membrane protein assembly complex protein YaeT